MKVILHIFILFFVGLTLFSALTLLLVILISSSSEKKATYNKIKKNEKK